MEAPENTKAKYAAPSDAEAICLVSYEVTRLRLGGGPDDRPSFWRVYREELALNQKTQFKNEHVRICRHHIRSLRRPPRAPVFFRTGRLVADEPETQSLLKEIE